jgi:hypothetical protein
MATLYSDSFGRSTGVSVRIETRPSGRARLGLILSCLLPLPLVPFVGALLGSLALRDMKRDAAIMGRKPAQIAYGLGLAFTVLQVGAVSLAGYSAYNSVSNAQSEVVTAYAIQAEAGQPLPGVGRVLDAKPSFAMPEFRPGRALPFELMGVEGSTTVLVTFSAVPGWHESGPMFAVRSMLSGADTAPMNSRSTTEN